ncbi:MAG: ABC transporter ATP-binding protein [Pseudomonadota bacterium]
MADPRTQSVPLIVKNVTIQRGRTRVVEAASLRLKHGDVLGLIGCNGAGKSTTLACLAGLIAPASGEITVAGADLLADPTTAKHHIGYLPDPPALHDELSVRRHLLAIAALQRIARAERAAAVEQALERVGLDAVASRRIGALSQGYRQRVGLAQAIVHRPALVLLDEPTNGLDLDQQAAFAETVQRLAKDAAVILSSHHMSDIRACCNRLALLDNGALVTQPTRDRGDTPETHYIRLQQPVTAAELLSLPVISDVAAHQAGWLVSVRGDASELSALLVDRGWGLLQLSAPPQASACAPDASTTAGEVEAVA